MSFVCRPWQFFVAVLVGWAHHEQKKIIAFFRLKLGIPFRKLNWSSFFDPR